MEELASTTGTHSPAGPPPSPSSTPSALIAKTKPFVQAYMSQPHFDASHDYAHIERVLALALHILAVEQARETSLLRPHHRHPRGADARRRRP